MTKRREGIADFRGKQCASALDDSNHLAIAGNSSWAGSNGLQPTSDHLQPTSDGLQPTSDVLSSSEVPCFGCWAEVSHESKLAAKRKIKLAAVWGPIFVGPVLFSPNK